MRRGRLHLTRTTIGVLAAVAVWLALMILALGQLDRPAVRRYFARQVAARLAGALGQPVTIADVSVTAFPPRIRILGLAVGDAARPLVTVRVAEILPGRVVVSAGEVVIDSVCVEGVRVAGQLPAAVTNGTTSQGWVRVIVRQLEVTDIAVTDLDLGSGLHLRLSDSELRWTGSRRSPVAAAVARVGAFTLEAPGIKAVGGEVMVSARMVEDGWEVRRVRGHGPGWRVDMSARSDRRGVRAEGSATIDAAEAERILRIGAGLRGSLDLAWQANVERGARFSVDARVSAPFVEVVGFRLDAIDGEVHLSPDGLEGSLAEARFAGGTVSGSYSLASFGAPWPHRVALRGAGIAIDQFLASLGVDAAGLGGRGRLSADVSWDGKAIGAGSGVAVADIDEVPGDVPLAGRVAVSLTGDDALHFLARDTTLAGAAVRWTGTLALGTWIPDWTVSTERAPVAVVRRLLRGWVGAQVVPVELGGEAALQLRLHGPFRDLTVDGSIAIAPVTYGPFDFDGVEAAIRVGQGVFRVEQAQAFIAAGRITGSGELRYGEGGAWSMAFRGRDVPLDRVVGWGGVKGPFAGRIGLDGELCGTLDHPVADARLRLSDVAVAGVPFGAGTAHLLVDDATVALTDITIGGLRGSTWVDFGARRAKIDARLEGFGLDGISPPLARLVGGRLDATLVGSFGFDQPVGRLEFASRGGAAGAVELDRNGIHLDLARRGAWRLAGSLHRGPNGYAGDVTFGVESWRRVSEDLAGAPLPVDGTMAGVATVLLNPPDAALINGEIRDFTITVEDETARLVAPAQFAVDGAAVTFPGLSVAGPHSALFVRGRRDADGGVSGNAAGEVPAALLALVWRDVRPAGRIELLGEFSGTDQAPRFEGVARVRDGILPLAGLPGPLTRVDGVLDFTPEAVRLAGLSFVFLGGEGTASGSIVFSPRVELDLALEGRGVRWPLILGLNPLVGGSLRLVGPVEDMSLSGRVVVERTVYRRDINLQRLILESFLAPERARASDGEPVKLNIAVDVPGTLELNTPLARLVMRGNLRVVGDTARFGVLGRLEALPGGELEFSGSHYELDHLTVTFSRPDRIEPFLDLLARASVSSFDVTVALLGTLDHLTPTFTSNPPLPTMDIVALISTGKVADEAGRSGAGTVASSFVLDQLTSVVTNRARTLLDVDQLRVDPFAATETGDPTARLTVVKQLNRDWTVTVATNLAANREAVINSRWSLGQGVYLEAVRTADGSYQLGVRWRQRY